MADYKSGYDPKYGYNRNAFAHHTMATKAISVVMDKVIMPPIALTSEAIASRRNQGQAGKIIAQPKVTMQADDQITEEKPAEEYVFDGTERDDEDWALDETVPDDTDDTDDVRAEVSQDTVIDPNVDDLIQSIEPAQPGHLRNNLPILPFPVVIPQRRPGTKTRGFVRAYAPVLATKDIDQEMFLRFLKSFHKAAQASPVFDIVMISCSIASAVPNPIAAGVCQAVQIAAGVGQELQERWRTNKFLDRANKEIFKPRGLYALIVTYKQVASQVPDCELRTVDVGAQAFARYGDALLEDDVEDLNAEGGRKIDAMKEKMKRLRVASGKTRGEAEMPVSCAPIIFPAIEAATENNSTQNLVAVKSKQAGTFVQDYFDRRSQAIFNANNRESALAGMVPEPQFRSKIADPNDARNRHLITLVTGGKIKAEPLGAKRRWEKAQRDEAQRRAQGLKTKASKRGLQEDVLYLMIVNMPTEQELEKARIEIEEAKKRKKSQRSSSQ